MQESSCPPEVALEIERLALLQGGSRTTAGWLGVLCPNVGQHPHDKVGKHARLAPSNNTITCFAGCGKFLWRDICAAWGITIPNQPAAPQAPRPKPVPAIGTVEPRKSLAYDKRWVEWLQMHPPALEYLFGRGITPEAALTYQLGYTGQDEALPYWEQKRIAIPWISPDGQIVAAKLRCIGQTPPKQLSYLSLQGSDFSGWFNLRPTDAPFRVAVETELDAILLSQALGYPHCAIACPAGNIGDVTKCLGLLDKSLYAFGDNDEAGRVFNASLKRFIPSTIVLPYPDQCACKDMGALYQARIIPSWLWSLMRPDLRKAYQ